MEKHASSIKALGEIVLRVRNLEIMQEFYENTVGLKLLKRFEQVAFFEIAPSYGGHTQVLGLFDLAEPPDHESLRFTGLDAEQTSLHHIAFVIDRADFFGEKERLLRLGLSVETQEYAWVHWRSLYVPDPEGNLVELVCYDETVQEAN
jgi:catechol-2,3-dioxygenase